MQRLPISKRMVEVRPPDRWVPERTVNGWQDDSTTPPTSLYASTDRCCDEECGCLVGLGCECDHPCTCPDQALPYDEDRALFFKDAIRDLTGPGVAERHVLQS